MTEKKHLPLYGVGPCYGITIIILTILGSILSRMEFLRFADLTILKIPLIITGILILLFGFFVWFKAAFRIDHYIKENELCTDGIYGAVRNPCYSGILIMCTGVLLISHNVCLLLLPVIYWAMMTILLKHTEEKWLLKLYGSQYEEYCKKVNRCIPWFPKK